MRRPGAWPGFESQQAGHSGSDKVDLDRNSRTRNGAKMMPRLKSWRSVVLAVVLASGLSAGAWAQLAQNSSTSTRPTPPQAPPAAASSQSPERFVLKDYSKPHSPFPNVIAPYRAEPVPPPTLVNTPRIDQLMHEGKIMLSMDDAVALALENNLD